MSEEQFFEEWWESLRTKEKVETVFWMSLHDAMLKAWKARAAIEVKDDLIAELEALLLEKLDDAELAGRAE